MKSDNNNSCNHVHTFTIEGLLMIKKLIFSLCICTNLHHRGIMQPSGHTEPHKL